MQTVKKYKARAQNNSVHNYFLILNKKKRELYTASVPCFYLEVLHHLAHSALDKSLSKSLYYLIKNL